MRGKRKVLRITSQKTLAEFTEEQKPSVEEEQQRDRFLAMISLASELGFSIALPIAGGALLGQFLDGKFNSTPRITLSLIFLGVFIGVYNIYVLIKKIDKKE